MSVKRGKQRRGENTKKHILEVALKLFSKKGYNNVTVDEIVKISKTSKGSFYLHFQSKHNIFLEKFKEIDNYYDDYIQTLPPHMIATQKILHFVNSQMTLIQHELGKELMRVIYSNALTPDQNHYFLNQERPLFLILYSIIEEGQQKQELDNKLSIQEIKLILTQGMMGSIYHWCMSNDNYNLQEESEKLFTSILKGLENKK